MWNIWDRPQMYIKIVLQKDKGGWRCRQRWENIIKIDLKKLVRVCGLGSSGSEYGPVTGLHVHLLSSRATVSFAQVIWLVG